MPLIRRKRSTTVISTRTTPSKQSIFGFRVKQNDPDDITLTTDFAQMLDEKVKKIESNHQTDNAKASKQSMDNEILHTEIECGAPKMNSEPEKIPSRNLRCGGVDVAYDTLDKSGDNGAKASEHMMDNEILHAEIYGTEKSASRNPCGNFIWCGWCGGGDGTCSALDGGGGGACGTLDDGGCGSLDDDGDLTYDTLDKSGDDGDDGDTAAESWTTYETEGGCSGWMQSMRDVATSLVTPDCGAQRSDMPSLQTDENIGVVMRDASEKLGKVASSELVSASRSTRIASDKHLASTRTTPKDSANASKSKDAKKLRNPKDFKCPSNSNVRRVIDTTIVRHPKSKSTLGKNKIGKRSNASPWVRGVIDIESDDDETKAASVCASDVAISGLEAVVDSEAMTNALSVKTLKRSTSKDLKRALKRLMTSTPTRSISSKQSTSKGSKSVSSSGEVEDGERLAVKRMSTKRLMTSTPTKSIASKQSTSKGSKSASGSGEIEDGERSDPSRWERGVLEVRSDDESAFKQTNRSKTRMHSKPPLWSRNAAGQYEV